MFPRQLNYFARNKIQIAAEFPLAGSCAPFSYQPFGKQLCFIYLAKLNSLAFGMCSFWTQDMTAGSTGALYPPPGSQRTWVLIN